MKVVYLDSAKRDLNWWRRYYRFTFPEGAISANRYYRATLRLVTENPNIGQIVEDLDIRRLVIPRTHFQLVYRVRKQTIEVIRLWDSRRQPTPGFQED